MPLLFQHIYSDRLLEPLAGLYRKPRNTTQPSRVSGGADSYVKSFRWHLRRHGISPGAVLCPPPPPPIRLSWTTLAPKPTCPPPPGSCPRLVGPTHGQWAGGGGVSSRPVFIFRFRRRLPSQGTAPLSPLPALLGMVAVIVARAYEVLPLNDALPRAWVPPGVSRCGTWKKKSSAGSLLHFPLAFSCFFSSFSVHFSVQVSQF